MALVDKAWILKHHFRDTVPEPVFDVLAERYKLFREDASGGGYDQRQLPRVDNIMLVLIKRVKAELAAAANEKAVSEKQRFQEAVAAEVVRQRGRDERHLKKTVLSKLARELASDE